MFTDHKPLTFALFRVSPPWSARQQPHLSYLSKFTSNLVHLISVPYVGSSILCDLFTSLPLPLVPVSLHFQIFNALHNISHPGVPPTWRLVLVPLFGLGSPRMSPTGPEGVYNVNRVKFSNLFTPLFPRFLFLPDSSVIFMCTWLGLFLVPGGSLISSQLVTGPPVGQRLFPCRQPLLRVVLWLWFPVDLQICCSGQDYV